MFAHEVGQRGNGLGGHPRSGMTGGITSSEPGDGLGEDRAVAGHEGCGQRPDEVRQVVAERAAPSRRHEIRCRGGEVSGEAIAQPAADLLAL